MAATAKEQFLKEFEQYYGYPDGPKSIDEIRATEFKRLKDGVVYLDHAGATLYSELQMDAIFKDFSSTLYGNPHSQSDSSSATYDIIAEARHQVLEYFNASPKDYKCIFTSGATAALKLVGESFPWNCGSTFLYTMENHNSVLGIREYALRLGASACAVDIEGAFDHSEQSVYSNIPFKMLYHPVQRRRGSEVCMNESTGDTYDLFAFPSECNFTGMRFNLNLVKVMKENADGVLKGSPFKGKGKWMILIDAAKGCATRPPDLSKYPADYVVVSFYKLFGYPTGLGALIARNDAAKLLKKTYFSGGTVAASIADLDFVKRRERIEELFEDGSASFLSIASVLHGFRLLKSLTVTGIWRHTSALSVYVKRALLAIHHQNGARVCTVYGSNSLEFPSHVSGPTISFNLQRPDGSWFGYREVEKLASLSGIHLRTGCFCNPGACAKYLGLSHSDLLANLEAGHVCWDDNDVINGKPTGAVRVSFGYMSTFEEAKRFIDFFISSFVLSATMYEDGHVLIPRSISQCDDANLGRENPKSRCHLKSITVYPIKSCGGFTVRSWPLCNTGLRHDREWLLQGLAGETLTQKKVTEMSLISTYINLDRGIMFVESPRCKVTLKIKVTSVSSLTGGEETSMNPDIFRDEDEVNRWFTNAIGRHCTLARCSSSEYCGERYQTTRRCRDRQSMINFANEAQFLLVSEESVSDLNKRLSANAQNDQALVQVSPFRFRPNLIISGAGPYAEDGWRHLKIGKTYFTSLGGCNRCQMININHQDGQVEKSKEPLATLASYRRTKGKILFGILLNCNMDAKEPDPWLHVGQEVHPNAD